MEEQKLEETNSQEINAQEINEHEELAFDFITSSAISRVGLKPLLIYIPIIWMSSLPVMLYWVWFLTADYFTGFFFFLWLPLVLIFSFFMFIFLALFFTKLFLVFINLIHVPKEGVFPAEKGNTDFEFWRLRIELKKIGVWLMNNCPLPWIDVAAFRWFGIKMDFSSHLHDSWCDLEFIKFGRKVMIGQGAVVMSSMVIGNYLIIKQVIFEDYTVVGGQSTVGPGTIIEKDTLLGAASNTTYKQILEAGWIYFGIPAIQLKKNKFAENRKVIRKDVDSETRYEEEEIINIDKDKNHLL